MGDLAAFLVGFLSQSRPDEGYIHRALGFEVGDPVADYDGPGLARVALTRRLG